jgi:hypothetical protein
MKNSFNHIAKSITYLGLSTLVSCAPKPESIYSSSQSTQSEINRLTIEQKNNPKDAQAIQTTIDKLVGVRKQKTRIESECSTPNNPDFKYGGENVRGETCQQVKQQEYDEN